MQLGECVAKCDQIARALLKPDTKSNLQLIYLAKGIRATTAIEGNTLTEEEVRNIIEEKADIPPSKEYLEQEIKNVLKACNIISGHIRENIDVTINPEKICDYNSIILENLQLSENVEPGKYRKHSVSVGRYLAPSAVEVPLLMARLSEWLNSDDFKTDKNTNPVAIAIIKAIVAHIYIAWIHPFGDGNGRTARLIEFKILAQSGVPLPAAHLLSNHYNNTRTEYYTQLDKTSKSGGEIAHFISYAVPGLLDGLNDQLSLIREQQIEVVMENYIHEKFRDKPGETWRRRRHLALDLLSVNEPVKKEEIPLISKRVNEAYKNKGARAISRDLAILESMELIISTHEGYKVNYTPLVEFLPAKKGE